MRRLVRGAVAIFGCLGPLAPAATTPPPHTTVSWWLTSADRAALVAPQHPLAFAPAGSASATRVVVDDTQRFQTIDGFGFAVTGGSAQLLHAMGAEARSRFLHDLLGTDEAQAGVSYIRVSIGASDMNDHVYTYDDMPAGKTDPSLAHFSLAEDETAVLPVLREMLAIRPGLKILASPWTAPSWMKSNELPKGGSLKPEMYATYAQYLVHYLQAMQAAGVPVTAVTLQNEPLNPKNTPSMEMLANEEETFLRDHFGPALRRAGLQTEVILWDHNCDHPEYPLTILRDAKAAQYATGSGFHLYAGPISAMSEVHDAFPQKGLFFTEQMVVEEKGVNSPQRPIEEPVARVVIGATRNWSRNVLLWNLAADKTFGPHTGDGGCPVCQGAVTIDGDQLERNIAFYTVAQVARFVPPGSVRIGSTEPDSTLADVAFRRPDGRHVLVMANRDAAQERTITVQAGPQIFTVAMPAGSVATFLW